MSVRLHVNVDHVATLRNARGTPYPDPVRAAAECLAAGADGITAHLREDRRHIVDDDVRRLGAMLRAARRTFNLEMAATDEMVDVARRTGPDVCTLVPERREERTTEGGLDVTGGGRALAARVRALVDAGIKVSLFIAADAAQIDASRQTAAKQIELHTGEYAHGRSGELARLFEGADRAHRLGLEVAAGHGLTQDNVPALMASPVIVELNIGHAVVADAVFLGLRDAVRAYRAAIDRGVAARADRGEVRRSPAGV
ncbi:MAG TPA: pyridoxine 5'-phosphate synthase [Polyangiaceae bacterium]|nr:pyridoxine 5'-phosphate synthase [Polyangiaceae bacterium]